MQNSTINLIKSQKTLHFSLPILLECDVKKLLIPFIAIFLFASIGINNQVNAQSPLVTKQLNREYQLNADGTANVTERMTVSVNGQYQLLSSNEESFIIFNPIVNDERAQEKLELSLSTLKVTDQNGNAISTRQERQDQNVYIYAKYPRNVRQGMPLTIQLSYTSHSLAAKSGLVYDIYIPSFAKDFKFSDNNSTLSVSTQVKIPESLGEINLITPEKEVAPNGGNYLINFTQEELTGNIGWIQVGTKQVYEFNITQPVEPSASTTLYSNTYEVLLPRNIQSGPFSQEVFYTLIEPKPYSVVKDENGNLKATFKLTANTKTEIKLAGYINLAVNKNFDFTKAGTIADIPAQIKDANTKSAEFWEVSDENIRRTAAEIKGDETDIYTLIEKTYDFVVERIDYSDVKRFGINERQGAAKTLNGGAAVCMEYSDLFIALLRAQGIAARGAFGYGYDFRSTNGIDTAHQWAEVYLPAQNTWLLVDTTWGESGNNVIGADLNHIYKYVASESPERPAPVQVKFVGNLNQIADEQFVITAVSETPAGEGLTADRLLEIYPEPERTVVSNLEDGASLILGTTDAALTNVFNRFEIAQDTQTILKIAILIIFIFTILVLVFASIRAFIFQPIFWIVRKVRRKKQNKDKVVIVKKAENASPTINQSMTPNKVSEFPDL